jgi:hypothetical protein
MILIDDTKLPLPRSNSLPEPSSDAAVPPSYSTSSTHLAPPPPGPVERHPSEPLLDHPQSSHVHFNRLLEVHTQSFRSDVETHDDRERGEEDKRRAQAEWRARDRFLKAVGTALAIWIILGLVLGNLRRL